MAKRPKKEKFKYTDENVKMSFDKAFKDLLVDIRLPIIGEIAPGIYHIGEGVYTTKAGFAMFTKILKDEGQRYYGPDQNEEGPLHDGGIDD